MKKRFLLVLTALFACVALHAQFAQMSLLTPHYYPGEVYFVDGHHEEFAELELPRMGKGQLAVKKNKDDKSRTTIDAANIIGIKIWHADYPDKAGVLYYLHAKKELMRDPHQWGIPVGGSEWATMFHCYNYYEMDKKTGELNGIRVVDENNTAFDFFYLMNPKWSEARMVVADKIIYVLGKERVKRQFVPNKKKAAKLFEENANVFKKIMSDELKASDIQYILEEMAGGKKSGDMQTKMPIVIETEQTSNGTTGDDE